MIMGTPAIPDIASVLNAPSPPPPPPAPSPIATHDVANQPPLPEPAPPGLPFAPDFGPALGTQPRPDVFEPERPRKKSHGFLLVAATLVALGAAALLIGVALGVAWARLHRPGPRPRVGA